MTPKKVWGVVIIVLGVFMVINGSTKMHHAEVYSNEFRSIDKMFSKYGPNKFIDIDFTGFQKLMEREKFFGGVGIFLGILCAIIGTLMLRDNKRYVSVDDCHENRIEEDDFDPENRQWKL